MDFSATGARAGKAKDEDEFEPGDLPSDDMAMFFGGKNDAALRSRGRGLFCDRRMAVFSFVITILWEEKT